ncbi:hypothetical protein I350_04715 [Cryptococcus amylolentus CBS 6273]|uniref:Uncharacterized protein n=1 Tax=Cryptococcus amylolentus CBS 6273 TaxID=1296118 RepID=A0A1E3JY18_9TREE|nr:hypothetical protein I350_04715 [Cryptococcus amylolentus CBS 6273]
MPNKEEDSIFNQELQLYVVETHAPYTSWPGCISPYAQLKHILQVWFEDSHEEEYLATGSADELDLEGWRFEVYPEGRPKEDGEDAKGVVINGDESPIALGILNAGIIYATRITPTVSPITTTPSYAACTRPSTTRSSSYASYGGGGYQAATERASAMVERADRCASGPSMYPSSLPMRS